MVRIVILFVVLSVGLFSCSKHNEPDFNAQLEKDIAAIDAYLAGASINATADPSGVRYLVTTVGTGVKPTLASTISVKYRILSIPDNLVLYASPTGVSAPLASAITGWRIGIPLMTKGSKFNLYIPSGLAFGTAGFSPTIAPNANLIYEIELLDDDAQLAADIVAIDTFLINTLHVIPDSIHKDPAGVRWVFAKKGTLSKPISTSSVLVTYTGKLIPTQKVFTVQTTSVSLPLSSLITGWQVALPQIPAGSQVTLFIPSGLGYGPAGNEDGSAPPDANLIFDINLIGAN